MKNFRLMVLAALVALVLAPAASALAEGAFYLTPKLGYSSLKAKSSGSITNGRDTVSFNASNSDGQAFFGLAFGYDFKKSSIDLPVRAEVEYAYRGEKDVFNRNVAGKYKDKLEVGVQSVFANVYYDIHNSSPVTPYIGLGLGVAVFSIDYSGRYDNLGVEAKASGNEADFAWNVGAGAAYEINDTISLDLGYRYADFGKVEYGASQYGVKSSQDVKAEAHEVMLGLRFSF